MVCGVVACKDNSKVSGCGDGCIAGSGGYKVVVVVWFFGLVGGMSEGWGKGENSHASFTQIKNAHF